MFDGAGTPFNWTDVATEDLLSRWARGESASEIAKVHTRTYGMRCTREAVLGKIHRMKNRPETHRRAPSMPDGPVMPRVAARARGGSRPGASIFTDESDLILIDGINARRELPAIAATITAQLNVVYSTEQLSSRITTLGLRRDGSAAEPTTVSRKGYNENARPVFAFGDYRLHDPDAYGRALKRLEAAQTGEGVSLLALEAGMCRNITGHDGREDLFCGAPATTVNGRRSSYCAACHSRLSIPTQPFSSRTIRSLRRYL